MKATYCSVRKWPLDLPESLSWDVCYKIGMPFPNGWLVGYENFPFVITENQSQIPPWVSLVKVKNKLKKHLCLRHSCFLNLFFTFTCDSQTGIWLWFSVITHGKFSYPTCHPLGNDTLLDFSLTPCDYYTYISENVITTGMTEVVSRNTPWDRGNHVLA